MERRGDLKPELFPIGGALGEVRTRAPGPQGALPLTEELLRESPSGDLFGLSAKCRHGLGAGARAAGGSFSSSRPLGGLREPDGRPIALGYHTGHWEIGQQVEAAARELRRLGLGALFRLLLRSVRRPHAGDHRDVRQPAVSQ